jgi:DNA-binding PadR family transcriptional regulator
MEHPESQSLLPLTPAVFHIMLALAGRESHGYGLMLEVERMTGGRTRIGPGTLYRSIQRMLVDGLIEELEDEFVPQSDDDRRRYYRLTEFGHRVVQQEAARHAELVDLARSRGLLAGEADSPDNSPAEREAWQARG